MKPFSAWCSAVVDDINWPKVPCGLPLSLSIPQLPQMGCPKGAAVLVPEMSSLLLVHVGICPTHRNSAELSKLLQHWGDSQRPFLPYAKAVHKWRLPTPAKPKGFAFLVNSSCRYPVNLTRGLWHNYQPPGYSRVVDGAGGGHGTAICSKHRDVTCALAFVSVAVDGLQQVVMGKWVVTTGIYSMSGKLSKLVRQHGPHSLLQWHQGHIAWVTKGQAQGL